MLCSVVDRLSDAVDGRGVVGRVGGDEFVVIAEVPDAAAATVLADACARATNHELCFGDTILHVRTSVGMTWNDEASGGDADRLVARADRAMYRAKKHRDGVPVLAAPSPDDS